MIMLAQNLGDGAATLVGAGMIAGVIATLKAAEWWFPRLRNGRNGNGRAICRYDDKQVDALLKVHEKTDADGAPLVYVPRGLAQAIEEQTMVLRQMHETMCAQQALIERRIEVCEKHTGILNGLKGR